MLSGEHAAPPVQGLSSVRLPRPSSTEGQGTRTAPSTGLSTGVLGPERQPEASRRVRADEDRVWESLVEKKRKE